MAPAWTAQRTGPLPMEALARTAIAAPQPILVQRGSASQAKTPAVPAARRGACPRLPSKKKAGDVRFRGSPDVSGSRLKVGWPSHLVSRRGCVGFVAGGSDEPAPSTTYDVNGLGGDAANVSCRLRLLAVPLIALALAAGCVRGGASSGPSTATAIAQTKLRFEARSERPALEGDEAGTEIGQGVAGRHESSGARLFVRALTPPTAAACRRPRGIPRRSRHTWSSRPHPPQAAHIRAGSPSQCAPRAHPSSTRSRGRPW